MVTRGSVRRSLAVALLAGALCWPLYGQQAGAGGQGLDDGRSSELTAVQMSALVTVTVSGPGASTSRTISASGVLIDDRGFVLTSVYPLQELPGCCTYGLGRSPCSGLGFSVRSVFRAEGRPAAATLVGCSAKHGLALLATRLRSPERIALTQIREVSPTEVAQALTPSGLRPVRLTSLATGSRLNAGADSRALEAGTPLVDGDGRLVGVAEREESQGNSRRTVVAGPADLRGFFSEYRFRTTVSPVVIHRDTRQLVVETTRLLGSFAGLEGTVTLEAEGFSPQTRQLMGGPEKRAATLPVAAPPSGGSLRKVRVTVSFRGGDGRVVVRKRYRVSADDKAAAGALPRPTPIPLGTSGAAALSASGAEKRTGSVRATRLSGIAARVSLLKDKDGSSVTLTNRTLEAGGGSSSGAYRFLKSEQDRSDAVRLDRLGAGYANLQGEKNRISAGRKQRGEVVWSRNELDRQYRDSYKRLGEIRTEAGAIVRRLLSRQVCRCNDGLWYQAAETPCHGCVLRNPTSSSKSGYEMRR